MDRTKVGTDVTSEIRDCQSIWRTMSILKMKTC